MSNFSPFHNVFKTLCCRCIKMTLHVRKGNRPILLDIYNKYTRLLRHPDIISMDNMPQDKVPQYEKRTKCHSLFWQHFIVNYNVKAAHHEWQQYLSDQNAYIWGKGLRRCLLPNNKHEQSDLDLWVTNLTILNEI